jgi:hypothetical protein
MYTGGVRSSHDSSRASKPQGETERVRAVISAPVGDITIAVSTGMTDPERIIDIRIQTSPRYVSEGVGSRISTVVPCSPSVTSISPSNVVTIQ